MKRLNINKLPDFVLWFCMIVTVGIFGFFYHEVLSNPDEEGIEAIGFILKWLYIIFIVSISVTFAFSFVQLFLRRKENRRSALQPLSRIGALTALFLFAYYLGNGNLLSISGYDGNENTWFWLKLTDMWLYSVYILLIVAILALLGGIIWNHVKRTR